MAKGITCRQITLIRKDSGGRPKTILDKISADFPGGSLSLITGPTGAGKSTLLNVVGGLIRPTAGEVSADGRPVSRWSAGHRDRWRREVGIVFQELHLMEELTALENVMMPLVPRGVPVADLRRRGLEALEMLAAVHLADSTARMLSGGQRQLIGIARALVANPRVLLADEPAAHQDAASRGRIRAAFSDLARQGACVLVAAHEDVPLLDGSDIHRRYRIEHGRLS